MNDPEVESEEGAIPPRGRGGHPDAILRNRNFLLYLIGRFVASMGQQMLTVALLWPEMRRYGRLSGEG